MAQYLVPVGVAVALLLAGPPAHASEDPAVGVLQAFHAASGGAAWNRVRTLHMQSDLAGGGLTGMAGRWMDLAHGWFADSSSLGPQSSRHGFDGKRIWRTDSAGQVQIEQGGDDIVADTNEAYRNAHGYWSPQQFPAAIESVGPIGNDDVLAITPRGGRRFELFIDQRSHLPDKMVEPGPLGTLTELYGDWHRVSGVLLPYRIETSQNDQGIGTTVETVRTAVFGRSAAPGRYVPPPAPPPDFTLPPGRRSVTLPFELENNHVYVDAKIDGAPVRLMFDTGSTGFLDTGAVSRLGLTAAGALPAQGAGAKIERGGLVTVAHLDLGGITFRDQVLGTLDESGFAAVEGRPVDGVLGYEIAKRLVVDLDYGARRLTLSEPASFRPATGAVAVPVKFFLQLPEIRAKVDGIEGEFVVDTGSRASLLLLKPFVERNGLQRRYGAHREGLLGWSIGGPVRGLLARAGTLEIGGVTVNRPVALIPERGPPVDGNIGGGILRHFDVAFDYAHDRIWFRRLDAAPDVYDRSGLWVNRGAGGIAIVDVLPESPAARAELAVGDVILTVDGADVSSLADLRDRLKQAPGTMVRLTIARDGAVRPIALTLEELF